MGGWMALRAWVSILAANVVMSTLLVTGAGAQQSAPEPPPPAPAPEAKVPTDEPTDGSKLTAEWGKDLVTTHHTLTINGQEIAYTATAGTMAMRDEKAKDRASLFFVAYTRDGVDDTSTRPVTFTFNGGPGSSSVWLHLGLFGPRRVVMHDDATPVPPPFQLVDNGYSLLDLTDFVFIDPVTTGYSRPAEDVNPDDFHGVDEDIESVGEFIRLYTTRFKRWDSPKFLAGESYGTTRAAGLSGHLQGRHGMYLNGIILISSILDFQTASFESNNDEPYILFLPTYAATAWYHHRLDEMLQRNLPQTLAEVEDFALGEYASALLMGDRLAAEEQSKIAAKLARYCGVSREFIEQCNLRPDIGRFVKELRRDERRTVGRLDSRFVGIDRDAVGDSYSYDPSYAAIQGPYSAALNHYVRSDLNYENDLPYEILTGRVHPWNYRRATNQYLDVAETLRSAMTNNPSLRVFVANGYYDLATPYFATQHTFSHMALDPTLRDHVTMSYYESGHMMYIHEPSLKKLRADLAAFIEAANPAQP